MTLEYSVLQRLPDPNQKVMAFGHRTFCCSCDMEKEPNWHECVFSFQVSSYKLKREIPHDLEDTILERISCYERWELSSKGEDQIEDHLIGVTKWKKIQED